jgi:hypothetical protein
MNVEKEEVYLPGLMPSALINSKHMPLHALHYKVIEKLSNLKHIVLICNGACC